MGSLYWCSVNKRRWTAPNDFNGTGRTCPSCRDDSCDFGPIVKPDKKQVEQLKGIITAKHDGPDNMIFNINATDYSTPPSKYHVPVVGIDVTDGEPRKVMIDVYAVEFALKQTPQVAHSFKKLWNPGARSGGKSYRQDIEEARRQLEMELNRLDLEERFNG